MKRFQLGLLLVASLCFGQMAFAQAGLKVSKGSFNDSSQGGGFAWIGNSPLGTYLSLDANEIQARNGSNPDLLFLNFYGGDISLVNNSFNADGKVGIGTLSPTRKLDVVGDIALSDGTGSIAFIESGITKSFINYNGSNLFIENDEVDGKIFIDAEDDLLLNTNDAIRMTINNIGDIGIGTTLPEEKLDIVGDALIRDVLYIEDNDNAGAGRISYTTSPVTMSETDFNTASTADGFIFESTSSSVEGSGFYGDGDYAIIWSPGDQNRLLRVYDEDATSSPERWYLNSSGTAFSVSDESLKENIQPLEDVLAKLQQINGVSYTWKLSEEEIEKGQEQTEGIGVLAQEVEAVFPQLVQTNEFGTKLVNYDGLIPVFIESIKAQQGLLDDQQEQLLARDERIANLEAEMLQMKSMMQQMMNTDRVELRANEDNTSINDVPSLAQNAPNPFNGVTTINYHIPEGSTQSQLQITDAAGTVIKVIDIDTVGAGQLEVDATALQGGNYFYTLIVDGEIVATKQMVLTK
ncbi:MAG: tail fiber domain-containing protein [Bacteroidota bacterium]